MTPRYLRPPCLYGRSQQQSRHLVLDLQLVVPLLLLRNHLLSMLLYPLLHGELHYNYTINPDPKQKKSVSHQKRITPSLRSHQRISSVRWRWVFCSSLTSRHAVVNISQRSLPPEYREREDHVHSARLLTGVPFWTNTSVDKWRSFMCSVVTRRKAVGGKESCLTLHNMSSLASTGIYVNQYLDRFERFFSYTDIYKSLPRFVQQVVAFFPTKPVSVCQNWSRPLSIHHSVSPSSQGRTELHDAAERGDVEAVERLLSTSVNINSRIEDVRLSTSECVVSFLTQFIDCCSTGLCIPTTCRKDSLLYC